MPGQLVCIVGPMFSGKTTALIDILHGAEKDASCLVLTHESDNRYTNELVICTHGQRKMAAKKVALLADVPQTEIDRHDAVLIDEGHFFTDLVPCADAWANAGKRVYVSMLKGNFRREPFTNAALMFSIADRIVDLQTDCRVCGEKGTGCFTQRTVADDQELLVGGADIYTTACRRCYFAIHP